MFSAYGREIVKVNRLSDSYGALLGHVQGLGHVVKSRLGDTKEILNFRLEIEEPQWCVTGRAGFSKKFMYEEIYQILAGVHDNDRLRAITPLAADLITPATAYGPRTFEQVRWCAQELSFNPSSRRAVVYVGRSDDLMKVDEEGRAGEMPCTETWQFSYRHEKLHMTVNMRSWDLVWGLGYDVPSFVAVQMALASHMGASVQLGSYVHNAGSAHIYDKHWGIKTWNVNEPLDLGRVLQRHVIDTQGKALNRLGR